MRWFYFTLIFSLLVTPSSLRADPESQCPDMVLGSGSAEGIYMGNDCADFCWATVQLDNGFQFNFICDEEDAEKFFGTPGNRVAVEYTEEQFWVDLSSHCMRTQVFKSGKIISAAQAPTPQALGAESPSASKTGQIGIAIKGFQLGMTKNEFLAQAKKFGLALVEVEKIIYSDANNLLGVIKHDMLNEVVFYHPSRQTLFNVNRNVSCGDFAHQFAEAYGIQLKESIKSIRHTIVDRKGFMEDHMIPMTVFDKVPQDKDWSLKIVCKPIIKGYVPTGEFETIIEMSRTTPEPTATPSFD